MSDNEFNLLDEINARVEAIENLKTVKSEMETALRESASLPLHRSKLFRGMGLILTLAPKSGADYRMPPENHD